MTQGTTLRTCGGGPGYFRQQPDVYDHGGEPCPQCGTERGDPPGPAQYGVLPGVPALAEFFLERRADVGGDERRISPSSEAISRTSDEEI